MIKNGETILHDDNGNIPVFKLELVNVDIELNKTADEVEFIEVKYAEIDEQYVAMDPPTPPTSNFEPLGVEEILQAQIYDPFCAKFCRQLNEWGGGV